VKKRSTVNSSIRGRRALLRTGAVAVAGFWLMGLSSFESLFIPSKKLWEHWIEHDPYSTTTIDHGPWGRLLMRYLSVAADGVNRFRYAAVSPSDRQALSAYVKSLESVPIRRYSKEEQLAYWINLYNAATVDVVLAHYPVESIRDIDISPGIFGVGPWGKKLFIIEGEEVSLNDIEHRILRPIWPDPRLHYALNCAAMGCPNLQPQAFSPDLMEEMLESAAHAFINSPRAVWPTEKGIAVSSLYAWYEEDFGGSDAGILAHLRSYAEPELRQRLSGVTRIDDHDYDWALNGTKTPKS
jgi:hypothetical protein